MPVPQIIEQLVERFERNLPSYKSGIYNETQVRLEFINPFFEALGWDVRNEKGYAEAYKDVVHEYSQKTADSVEAPDYCFRIGGTRKFFVEAKKPSVNVKHDIQPAFQVRRYAWSAKLPLSILTDFEEFAVYDCRIPPKKNDKSSTARIIYFNYKDYLQKWDEIESIFSRDSILKGSFDKYAETNKKKKGTAEVDDTFLKTIEQWREFLAKNIALRNPDLTTRELNYSVQKTIDRIIFLRICEDRGIEEYGQLMALQNGSNVYQRMVQIFTRADEKYNSGLFHFEFEKNRTEGPDELTPALSIDDKILKEIINNLYYPESPFEFSVLPADILGQVYEQFLGKVIRLTEGHQAKIENKPEVKKAGGVYYTPTYIVDYIVQNTLGNLLTGNTSHAEQVSASKDKTNQIPKRVRDDILKTPKDVSKIKILDPACGSGSFLIAAYQYLLDWHLKYYTSDNENIQKNLASKNPKIYQASNGEFHLTTAERKRILLNNIYGVDIDPQAVEVTKLSLLLKVLEGENEETLNSQLKMFHERALPDLANNIKCGNSLIGPDFYNQMEMNFLNDEEKLRINVFDWNTEFKEIMDNGGFDVVIGNPPWIDIKGLDNYLVDYYFKNYYSTENRMNVYATFIEKSINLTKKDGFFGFITPSSFYTQSSYKKLREFILDNIAIKNVVRLPDRVFQNVIAETIITLFSKVKSKKCEIIIYKPNEIISEINNDKNKLIEIDWKDNENKIFNIYSNDKTSELIKKIETAGKNKLSEICEFSLGITPYDKYRGHSQYQIKNRVFHSLKPTDDTFKPLLSGENINRYYIDENNIKEYISYGKWLGAPRDKKFFTEPRIIIRQIISGNPLRIFAGYTKKELYNTQIAFNIIIKDKNSIDIFYILAILNSRLMTFYHRNKFLDLSKKIFQKILIQDTKNFPIVIISKKEQEILSTKVEEIMSLIKKINNAKTPQEKIALQRQIESTDKKIDQLVYKLYGLTEEEIKIVEGG